MEKFLPNERLAETSLKFAKLHQDFMSRTNSQMEELPGYTTVQTYTECGSKVGIAVSLIEGMIATSRILWMMDLSPMEIQEALKNMKDTYELDMLLTLETESPQGRIHDEVWRKRNKTLND